VPDPMACLPREAACAMAGSPNEMVGTSKASGALSPAFGDLEPEEPPSSGQDLLRVAPLLALFSSSSAAGKPGMRPFRARSIGLSLWAF